MYLILAFQNSICSQFSGDVEINQLLHIGFISGKLAKFIC
jgi:hypothetical protein